MGGGLAAGSRPSLFAVQPGWMMTDVIGWMRGVFGDEADAHIERYQSDAGYAEQVDGLFARTSEGGALKRTDPGWFKVYWEREKDVRNKARRHRYLNDPEYAEKVRQQTRDYRAKQRKKRLAKPKPERAAARLTGSVKQYPKPVLIGAKEEQVYTARELCAKLGISYDGLRQWRTRGLFPEPELRAFGGAGFTDGMCEVVVSAHVSRGRRVRTKDATFRREIVEGWAQLGVGVLDEGTRDGAFAQEA